jgi:hypothetical protein
MHIGITITLVQKTHFTSGQKHFLHLAPVKSKRISEKLNNEFETNLKLEGLGIERIIRRM